MKGSKLFENEFLANSEKSITERINEFGGPKYTLLELLLFIQTSNSHYFAILYILQNVFLQIERKRYLFLKDSFGAITQYLKNSSAHAISLFLPILKNSTHENANIEQVWILNYLFHAIEKEMRSETSVELNENCTLKKLEMSSLSILEVVQLHTSFSTVDILKAVRARYDHHVENEALLSLLQQEDVNWAYAGIGQLLLLAFEDQDTMIQNLEVSTLVSLVFPILQDLLQKDEPAQKVAGDIMSYCEERISENSISLNILHVENEGMAKDERILVMKLLIAVMAKQPIAHIRKRMFTMLTGMLLKFAPASRYDVLLHFATTTPYVNATSAIMDILRSQYVKLQQAEVPDSPFSTRNVLNFATQVLEEHPNILNSTGVYVSIASLWHYIVLRNKNANESPWFQDICTRLHRIKSDVSELQSEPELNQDQSLFILQVALDNIAGCVE